MNNAEILETLLLLIEGSLLVASCGVLVANFVPALNLFLKYGKTLRQERPLHFMSFYVPKYLFTHFYVLHTCLSIINIKLILFNKSTPFTDLKLISIINLLQSLRRLYECIYISKFSRTAKIHIFHYLVGIFFYSTINIIPQIENLLGNSNPIGKFKSITFLTTCIFLSFKQYKIHKLLSNQKKYTLPKRNLFKCVVCPHYFYEMLIYLVMVLIKPSVPFLLILNWVIINLSISAKQSFIFYQLNNEISNKQYKVIPFIY